MKKAADHGSPTISRPSDDRRFIVGEVLAFALPIMITWIIKKKPPELEDVILATGFTIAFGVFYIFGHIKNLVANDEKLYADYDALLRDSRRELARVHDRNITLDLASEYEKTFGLLTVLDGPDAVFVEHARKKATEFVRDLQGWRQKAIQLSFEEYAERLGFLCQHSSQSIDVVARSEVSKFWEHDWQDTLIQHSGKPVRRVFVLRTFEELPEGYLEILTVHASTYGAHCIYVTSEKALENIRLTLGYTLPPGMDFGIFDRKVLSRLYADRAIIIALDTPGQETQELNFEAYCRLFEKLINKSVKLSDVWNSEAGPLSLVPLQQAFDAKRIGFEARH